MSAPAASPGVATDELRAEAVRVVAEGRTILEPTTLEFRRARVTGIVGHNGSGKTTLLKCLARQSTPTTGQITLDGQPLSTFGARAFARKLAYLPQQTPAATGLTGRELVAYGRYPWHGALGRIGSGGHRAIAEAMRLSDTTGFADRWVDVLSGGERQRVWVAMLIAQDTQFIVLDEPIAALDLAHQIEVLGVLRDLARTRRAGIVLVLHDINMAARFCDEIVALRDARVIVRGVPQDIMRADVLGSIFGIPMRVLVDEASGRHIAAPA